MGQSSWCRARESKLSGTHKVIGLIVIACLITTISLITDEQDYSSPSPSRQIPGDSEAQASAPEAFEVKDSELSQQPDLTDVRRRVENEIASTAAVEGLVYRLHELTFENDRVILALDLQFRPESIDFLKEDCRLWADLVRYSKIDGEYISDKGTDVRVSFWTVFGPDEIIDWGSYRYTQGVGSWDEGEQSSYWNNSEMLLGYPVVA